MATPEIDRKSEEILLPITRIPTTAMRWWDLRMEKRRLNTLKALANSSPGFALKPRE
jgi:hypothetical protein